MPNIGVALRHFYCLDVENVVLPTVLSQRGLIREERVLKKFPCLPDSELWVIDLAEVGVMVIQTWEIINISIPPVTCTDGAASGAVAGKSQARSFRVTSDDVRRTSFKLLTELMVTHCISSI